jgi:hypothetical protein
MAEYCDFEDIERYGVNRQALDGFSDDNEKRPAIKAASGRMDGYLRAAIIKGATDFALPLVSWGEEWSECAAVLSAWILIAGNSGFKPGENPEDTVLRMRYEDMIKWLEGIADRSIAPPGLVGTPPAATTPGFARVSSNQQRGYQSETSAGGAFTGRRR